VGALALNAKNDLWVVLVTVVGSLLFMAILNRLWPWEKRQEHNNLIGWQLSVLGTTYAVLLGFMLFTVWTNFTAAELNADVEANSLVNVYHLADGLPDQQREEIKTLARQYADTVLEKEWPEMDRGELPLEGHYISEKMWNTIMSERSATPTESTAEDHAISELTSMSEHHRTRLLQSEARLPQILWWVLIVGGVLTIASGCLFGSGSFGLHAVQVFALSTLISLVLLAIADIDRPFQGAVHVTSYAFQRAQAHMREM
jgi:hypothetical protein